MNDTRAMRFGAGRAASIAVGLCLMAAQAVGQEVEFEPLWSHETGG